MIVDYLNELKTKSGFSWSELSDVTSIPESSLRKIFNRTIENPGFDTVVKIVVAMGGDLNYAIKGKEEEVPVEAVSAMQEVYENRIAELKAHAENTQRICEQNIAGLRRDKRILAIVAGVLIAFVLVLLGYDVFNGGIGWFRY